MEKINLYAQNNNYKLFQGSMLDMLDVINPKTIDSIITDPPYELNFMGKGWDNSGIAFQKETWEKCFKVLKPGGYLLAFGGSRTFHRIACAIEDAGFEIRDTIMWLYGSGFPKSMDISKQIDKRAESNIEVIKEKQELGKWLKEKRGNRPQKEISKYFPSKTGGLTGCVANWEKGYNLPTWEIWIKLKEILNLDDRYDYLIKGRPSNYIEAEREVIGKGKAGLTKGTIANFVGTTEFDITAPSTDLAKQWQGWGTALKPAFEPIIIARKPFKGSLVDNVIEYGVGGINVDECRVGNEKLINKGMSSLGVMHDDNWVSNTEVVNEVEGRFPANTILTYDETDFDEVCGGFPKDNKNNSNARYFYCAKASKKDRDDGLDEFEEKEFFSCLNTKNGSAERLDGGKTPMRKNTHPTVKPTELMQYLIRLVTPNGGIILDPFNGSGSTGKAVMCENKEKNKNYKFIGIEITKEYLPISKARIDYVCNLYNEMKFKCKGE